MRHFAFYLLIINLLPLAAFSQASQKASVWVAPFEVAGDSTLRGKLAEHRGQVVIEMLKNGAFSVVERDAQKFVAAELELQKSEAFIDGKIVEQGKSVGASFVLTGLFNTTDGLLTFKILDVEAGNAILSEVCDLGPNLKYGDRNVATSPSWKKIRKSVNTLISKWLSKEKASVVRILEEKGDKARKLLVAGGTSKGFKKGDSLEIFYIEQETIEEEVLERFVSVGSGKIELVENANFSQVKVTDGESEIKALLMAGKKLYCKLKND